MAYTFWHRGVLIGESDLEAGSTHPRQRGGIFWPTAYGLQLLPRLSGMLSAAHALKIHLDANNLVGEAMEPCEIEALFDNTPAGQKIVDIGRMLSDVEMRGADGRRLEFKSIAFSEPLEVGRIARELGVSGADELTDLPPDAPRYVVSATLSHSASASPRPAQAERFRRGH